MGISEPAQRVAELMVEEAKQGSMLVFHNGDISYARGYVSITHTVYYHREPNSLKKERWKYNQEKNDFNYIWGQDIVHALHNANVLRTENEWSE